MHNLHGGWVFRIKIIEDFKDLQDWDDADASSRHCGLDPPVHRDENDEERSSSALKAHTLIQRDQRLINPGGGA